MAKTVAVQLVTMRIWPDPDNPPFGTLEQLKIRTVGYVEIEDNEALISADAMEVPPRG